MLYDFTQPKPQIKTQTKVVDILIYEMRKALVVFKVRTSVLKLFMNGQQIRCFCSWCDVLLMFSWPFHEVGFCCININSLFNRVEIADRFQVALVLVG